MKYLNPLVFITKLIALIKELVIFRRYLGILSELDKNGELDKLNLRKTRLGRLYYVKNLQPEVLLNTDDPITRLGIIDFVKTGFRRIKTPEVYAYLVWMEFDFKQLTLDRILYLVFYPIAAFFVISLAVLPAVGYVEWSQIWQTLNSK
jgi:hypothetical protein